jgi:regulator of nucleoside diphosphate kinase
MTESVIAFWGGLMIAAGVIVAFAVAVQYARHLANRWPPVPEDLPGPSISLTHVRSKPPPLERRRRDDGDMRVRTGATHDPGHALEDGNRVRKATRSAEVLPFVRRRARTRPPLRLVPPPNVSWRATAARPDDDDEPQVRPLVNQRAVIARRYQQCNRLMFQGENAMTATPNPRKNQADVILEKPPIRVTTWDYRRLSAVVDAFRLRDREPLVDLLAQELDRAELVEPAVVPRDVVTMHACVTFIDEDTKEVRTVTLVYPGEEDSRQGKIAVVTPVGSALIGLQAGATMAWRTMDGRTKRLSVLEVRHQPEAHGFDGASDGSNRESAPSRFLAAAAAS